jgi:hypothetical protein
MTTQPLRLVTALLSDVTIMHINWPLKVFMLLIMDLEHFLKRFT